jgi:hypothetical protein
LTTVTLRIRRAADLVRDLRGNVRFQSVVVLMLRSGGYTIAKTLVTGAFGPIELARADALLRIMLDPINCRLEDVQLVLFGLTRTQWQGVEGEMLWRILRTAGTMVPPLTARQLAASLERAAARDAGVESAEFITDAHVPVPSAETVAINVVFVAFQRAKGRAAVRRSAPAASVAARVPPNDAAPPPLVLRRSSFGNGTSRTPAAVCKRGCRAVPRRVVEPRQRQAGPQCRHAPRSAAPQRPPETHHLHPIRGVPVGRARFAPRSPARRTRRQRRGLLRAEAVSSVFFCIGFCFPALLVQQAPPSITLRRQCAARCSPPPPRPPTVTRPPPPASVVTATIVAGACSVGAAG